MANDQLDLLFEQWGKDLLDLSRRNPLINFRPNRALCLVHPSPGDLFDGLINRGRQYTIFQPAEDDSKSDSAINHEAVDAINELAAERDEDSRDGTPAAASIVPTSLRQDEIATDGETRKTSGMLYHLRRRARTAQREQGINVLFVTLGLLDWNEVPASSTRLLSPLVLLPVRLERETALDPYTLAPLDDRPTLNPALTTLFEQDFQLKFGLPVEGDDGDLHLDQVLDHLQQQIVGRPEWIIRPEVYLGIFSFAKYAMYEDLRARRPQLQKHPVIRALGGMPDLLPEPSAPLFQEHELDDRVPPSDVHQVLDADASQQKVLAGVRAGVSLVIQGPPGTGKSQTITNAIAEAMARGQKVLFVSEKIAALEVVAKRLMEAGLHDFVLKAHSQSIDKAQVVRELASALQPHNLPRGDSEPLTLERLALLRAQLNAYVRALHDAANPVGRSAYWVHGELARLCSAPNVPFNLADIRGLTGQRVVELEDIVRRLAEVGAVLLDAENHPWYGCKLTSFTPQVYSRLDDQFGQLESIARALAATQTAVRQRWALPTRSTLMDAQWLADLLKLLDRRPTLPRQWLDEPRLDPLGQTARDWERRLSDYRARRSALLALYHEQVLAVDLPAIQQALAGPDQFPPELVRGLDPPPERLRARQDDLQAVMPSSIVAFKTLSMALHEVASWLGVASRPTLAEARRVRELAALVLTDPRPRDEWFDSAWLARFEDLVVEAGRQQGIVSELRPLLHESFEDDFLPLADAELGQGFEQVYASRLRWLRPGYHHDLGRIQKLSKAQPKLGYSEAARALRQAQRLNAAQRWLEAHRTELAAGLGSHYRGAHTDWTATEQALRTVRELLTYFGAQPPATLKALLQGAHGGPAAMHAQVQMLVDAISKTEAAFAALSTLLALDEIPGSSRVVEDVPLDWLADWLEPWFKWQVLFWQALDILLQQRRDRDTTVATLAAEVAEALALRVIEAELDSATPDLQQRFGVLFAGLGTHWDEVQGALDWVAQLRQQLAGPPAAQFIETLWDEAALSTLERRRLDIETADLARAIAEVTALFDPAASPISTQELSRAPLDALADWAQAQRQRLAQLEGWIDLNQTLERAHDAGLQGFVDNVRRLRPRPADWLAAYQRQLWSLWLTWWYDERPELAQFRGEPHERIIDEFRRLDTAQFRLASQRIAGRLLANRPTAGIHLHPRSEPAILQSEATKKRRFRPLRRLFADLPTLLPTLKPCLLMSPLSVAQFLGDSAIEFDLVLFDEASQILPADAIGAIGRGKQVVVVGDNKQLPPTNFFSTRSQQLDEDSEDEEGEEPAESILDACQRHLPQEMLRWHYRSRHEELIACSNRWFYDSRLITFPSPFVDVRHVEFVYVPEGVYDRGGSKANRVEAQRVVDRVIEQVQRRPDQSLGVITFSEPQMVAISTELDARKRAQPQLEALLREDGPEGFFVKNLENVQGDERDVIIFSIGYGPDLSGKMTMNFGPLNQRGGERRLNVAISRAREHVTVLASFHPQAIDRDRAKAAGVRLLRQYLEFAVQGPSALVSHVTSEGGEPESPFEEAVLAALRARGLRVVSQVGVNNYRIDLAIKDEDSDRYLLGIECDGATYHRTPTARDRDRLRQQILQDLGWHIHRIWSTDWLKDPAREVEKVLAALEQARTVAPQTPDTFAGDADASTPDPTSSSNEWSDSPAMPEIVPESSQIVGTAETAPLADRYVEAILPLHGDLESFRLARTETLAHLVHRCVEVEGPVHQDRVFTVVARAFGVARVGKQVRAQLLEAIAWTSKTGGIQCRGQFLWLPEMSIPPVRSINAAGQARPIHQIAPEEVEAACQAVLKVNHALEYKDTVVAIARLLGYDRTGGIIGSTIAEVIDRLIATSTLRDVGGQLSIDDRKAG